MILDLGNGFFLRQATAADHAALCLICLRTGDAGRDATAREDDPDLLGLIFAVPYQVLEPGFAFAVEGPEGATGYLFGTPDTAAFNARLAADWYPQLQRRILPPDPQRPRGSDWARRLIHAPDLGLPEALREYSAHGHIDLLPPARGQGIGRKAMEFLEERLRAAGCLGMHLPVDPRNQAAQSFYRRLGFHAVSGAGLDGSILFMAKRFVPEGSAGA